MTQGPSLPHSRLDAAKAQRVFGIVAWHGSLRICLDRRDQVAQGEP